LPAGSAGVLPDELPVVFANAERAFVESTLGELLPQSFGPEDLA
jgi:cytidine deaminase